MHAYRPDVDGLRAVAVVSVVLFHAFPAAAPGGFAGVDLFFVISGFLISGIILSDLGKGSFTIAEFYRRRVRRIFPALILVLAACLAIGWRVLLPDEFRQLGKHIAAGAGFVSNLALWRESGYFAPRRRSSRCCTSGLSASRSSSTSHGRSFSSCFADAPARWDG